MLNIRGERYHIIGAYESSCADTRRALSVRSLLLLTLFFAAFPFILTRPYFGIYLWSLFGYLNPHRLTWGIAYDFPFALLIAAATLVGTVFTRERAKLPWSGMVVVWIVFVLWMCITTVFALDSEQAFYEWDRTMKIQLFSFLTIILINTKEKLRTLIWVIALSVGFYGIKGGLFAIATGASFRVWGPVGSFIYDNNAIGLAFIMTIPLQWYLMKTAKNPKIRYLMMGSLLLTVIATLATHSRGAFLGLATITVAWLLHEKKKGLVVCLLILAIPATLTLMPDSWSDRMSTVKTYDQDQSAMGRILAWQFAMEFSTKRFTGGGFGAFTEENYRLYAPTVAAEIDERDSGFQNAHSIYFSALGDHGILGLALFLGLGAMTLRKGRKLQKLALERGEEDLAILAVATRIGLMGYAVTGAFLNLAYFDLYYHLVAIIVILDRQLQQHAVEDPSPAVNAAIARG